MQLSISIGGNLVDDLSAEIASAVKAELETAMPVIEAEAKARAPRRTGALSETIHAFLTSDTTAELDVLAPYASFITDGTMPHLIRARSKRALAWPGGAHPVRVVHHPGTQPNPYLQDAIDAALSGVSR